MSYEYIIVLSVEQYANWCLISYCIVLFNIML